jgi:ribosomal protein L7/L12
MNQETVIFALLFFTVAGVFTLITMMQKQRVYLRCLNIKLDALLKAQGVEWPLLSPEAQSLALEGRKIAAIKTHREEHPGIGLAEAKVDVEAFAAKKH